MSWDNPLSAIDAFLAENRHFVAEEREWPFNEGLAKARVTYWPRAYLRRNNRQNRVETVADDA